MFRSWRLCDAPSTAARVGERIDALEACRDRVPEADRGPTPYGYGEEVLTDLADQVRQGNAAAATLLDSLRADGLFDRHPRLAPLADAGSPK